ncbi:MAG: hypothetical protein KGS72_13045 [Cyanobacteria bacterium REEB67]|nr:hypothetical protein [Cyanobacteria bacterium REEB67]
MYQDKQPSPEQPGDKAKDTVVGKDGLSARDDVSRAAAPKDLAEAERRRTFKSTGSFDPEQEMSIEIDMGNGQTASRRSKSDTPFDLAAASKRDEERRLEAIRATHPLTSGGVLQAGLIYDESPLKYGGVKNADDVAEKLSGEAEGLGEAFNEGIAAAAKDPNLANKGLADAAKTVTNAGAYVADKVMSQDWDGVTRDAEKVVEQVVNASDKYSAMSQHDQGKVIGKYFMPAFTPDLPGIVQEAKTLGKSEEALAEIEGKTLAGQQDFKHWEN